MIVGGVASAGTEGTTFTAGLVSDIGKFNDKGFNEDQLAGLKRAGESAARREDPRGAVVNENSDYLPNVTTEVREGANIVSAAGYLLAPTLATGGSAVPERRLHDHRRLGQGVPAFTSSKNNKNIEGLVYASNEVGLPRRLSRRRDGHAGPGGKQVIGASAGSRSRR